MRLLFYLLLTNAFAASAAKAQTPQLDVVVDGIRTAKGNVKVCVFTHAETFLKKADHCELRPLGRVASVTVSFPSLPPGTYAVSVYQDENGNQKLDRNRVGLPAEPYGFSNNPSTLFGPPSFKKASFTLYADRAIRVTL